MSVNFMVTSNDNISFHISGGFAGVVPKDHLNRDKILTVLKNAKKNGDATAKVKARVTRLLDILGDIKAQVGNVAVHDNAVSINGKEVKGIVVQKILEFQKEGWDVKPLCKFLHKTERNPSETSKASMYSWLEKAGLIIDNDGDILGYKAVRADYLDIHSSTFSNRIGSQISMPRESVDDNTNQACGAGLHVGTLEYASSFGGSSGRLMVVKVDPANVVAVPSGETCKMRVCSYKVIDEITDKQLLKQSNFVTNVDDDDDDYDDDDISDDDFDDDDDYEDDDYDDDDFDDDEDEGCN